MSMPVLKLRQPVRFPANVYGNNGIDVSKANGNYTIETDWSGFPSLSAFPTSPTNSVLSYDTLTGAYALVPTPLLTGTVGTVNANDLSGTTLASNVINSSLHTVGTLTGGSTGSGFTINLSASAVSGTLPIASGGTGATTAAAALSALGALPLAGGTLSGPLILAADPAAALGAATKQYVDNLATGLKVKNAVAAASTANVNIASAPSSLNGVTGTAGMRWLLKDQTLPAQNGIYVFASTGAALTRATDLDAWDAEVVGAYTFVTAGSTLANTGWVTQVAAGGTLGTTAMPWGQFSSQASYTAGPGVSLSGTNFLLDTGSVTNSMLAAPVSSAKGGTGQNFGASNGIALYTVGAASILDTIGTGRVVREGSPTITGTLTAAAANFSGNVGIGTSAPLGALDVKVATNQHIISTTVGAMAFLSFLNDAADAYVPGTINANPLLLNAYGTSGNVGIGTLSPAYKLDVVGDVRASNAVFRNGTPWADITAWGAIGDGNQSRAAANTTAIQNAINQVASMGGGVVYVPAGNYVVAPGINVSSNIRVVGAGKACCGLSLVWGTDAPVVTLGPDGHYMGLEYISLTGYIRNGDGTGISFATGAAATWPCVYVPPGGSQGTPVFISSCFFQGGRAGLLIYGSDGFIIDSFIWGWHACLESYGSNSYIRCKFDSMNTAEITFCAYYQGTPAGGGPDAIENVFTNCDFSGNYNYSVYLYPHADDISGSVGNRMLPHFYACAMSRDIIITYAEWASFVSCELGHIHASNSSKISLSNCCTPFGTGGIHNDDATCQYKVACCFNIDTGGAGP